MNIIILSGATGGGHNRASSAMKTAIEKKDPQAKVDVIDIFEECSKSLNVAVTQGYRLLAQKAPTLYGKMYINSDKEATPLNELMNNINMQCGKKLLPVIQSYHPDVVISCHPFGVTMMSTIKEKYGYDVPTIAVITDFMPHMAYICDNMDAYVTASEETAQVLVGKYHVKKDIVYPLGLPIFDRFYRDENYDREKTLSDLGLDPKLPTVLVMAGSFGVTDILKIYETLVDTDFDFQMIVITGRNQKLYDAFEKLLSDDEEKFKTQDAPQFIRELPDDNIFRWVYDRTEEIKESIESTFERSTTKKKPTKLFFFIDNVEDYMHCSDLIITKPGGLTTSESIASHLPMAIFKAFPGQEAQNADYLVRNGIAVMLQQGDGLKAQMKDLLSDKKRLSEMREACRRCGRPNSAENIYELAKKLAEERKNA